MLKYGSDLHENKNQTDKNQSSDVITTGKQNTERKLVGRETEPAVFP
jgi:hypothetical protein